MDVIYSINLREFILSKLERLSGLFFAIFLKSAMLIYISVSNQGASKKGRIIDWGASASSRSANPLGSLHTNMKYCCDRMISKVWNFQWRYENVHVRRYSMRHSELVDWVYRFL